MFLNFVWKTKVKILWVYFCNDQCASCVKENWTERIQAFTWGKNNLSIVGKICIIKTFLISQLVYIMQALVTSEKTLGTSVEDTAQYLPNKYTSFKDKSEGYQQMFVLY